MQIMFIFAFLIKICEFCYNIENDVTGGNILHNASDHRTIGLNGRTDSDWG